MAALSKPKFRIKRLAEYRSISNGYSWDNGSVAFGGHIYDHKLYNKQAYHKKKDKQQ